MKPLELLLARFDDRSRVLGEGLPAEALDNPPPPPTEPPARGFLFSHSLDQNSLPAQRWGLVVPRGERGARLRQLVAPLVASRERLQQAPVKVFEVPPPLDAEALAANPMAEIDRARRWKANVLCPHPERMEEVPRYLLILGDLDEVPLELQQVLGGDSFYVGRLTFPDDAGFESYVAKVLAWEGRPASERKGRSLFYTVQDEDAVVEAGHRRVVSPCLQLCDQQRELGRFPVQDVLDLDDLAEASRALPSVLLTLSHGVGAPRNGWSSTAEQRAFQGALSLGRRGQISAADMKGQKFLPGGFWFYFACFGAGTPLESAYHHWLMDLKKAGRYAASLEPVLASLPPAGGKPFTAALPQAVLSHPDGPLGVIGHVDLAWLAAFEDIRGHSQPSRLFGVLKELVDGSRVGVAVNVLSRALTQVSVDLSTYYDRLKQVQKRWSGEEQFRLDLASLWMTRQDLSRYVLLGDPAVRLPLTRPQAQVQRDTGMGVADLAERLTGVSVRAPGTTPLTAEQMAQAVLAVLKQDSEPRRIAERLGVTIATLREWEDAYKQAGLEVLRKRLLRTDSRGDM